jgi:hypothetical protein
MPKFVNVMFAKPLKAGLSEKMKVPSLALHIKVVLKDALSTSQSNNKIWEKLAADYKEQAKAAYQSAEKAVEDLQKGVGDSQQLLKVIAQSKQTVGRLSQDMEADAKEYGDCFAVDDFRNDLFNGVTSAVKALKGVPEYAGVSEKTELGKDIKKLTTETASARAKIIESNMTMSSDLKRIKEYVVRLDEFSKLAEKQGSGKKPEKSAFVDLVKNLQGKIGNVNDLNSLLGIYTIFEKKIVKADKVASEGKDKEVVSSNLMILRGEAEQRRKELSGMLKTTLIEFQSLKTTYAKESYAKDVVAKLEKTLVKLSNDVKMQEARYNRSLRLLEEALKKLGG